MLHSLPLLLLWRLVLGAPAEFAHGVGERAGAADVAGEDHVLCFVCVFVVGVVGFGVGGTVDWDVYICMTQAPQTAQHTPTYIYTDTDLHAREFALAAALPHGHAGEDGPHRHGALDAQPWVLWFGLFCCDLGEGGIGWVG